MRIDDFINNSFNIEINDYRINDVAQKVGFLLFGETGRIIGKIIDDVTKDKTIEFDTENDK